MKILMINSVCGIGSTGRICTDLATELEKQGHTVKIAYGRGNVSPALERFAIRIGTDLDTMIHGVQARIFDCAGLGSKKATDKFIEWMQAFDPDTIHLHNVHGYYVHVPTLFDYLKKSRAKVVWTLHDTWAFSGHSGTCDKMGCKKWRTGCGNCPLIRQYPSSLLDRSKYNWSWKNRAFTSMRDITIVTPSQWLAAEVKDSFLKNYPVRVIHNGINTDVFKPCNTDIRSRLGLDSKFVILGVSNAWNRYKGLNDFFELNRLIDREKFQIIMVGLTKEQLKKLPEGIIGIARTKDIYELVELYSMADVFVNMTYCDVFSMVNVEAISCNTPVISYDTGGVPETVDDFGGVIVHKGDVFGIYTALESAYEGRLAVKNYEHFKDKFGKEIATQQYISLY